MGYAVSQLFNASIKGKPDFAFVKTDLPKLMERVCNYYQKLSELRKIKINYSPNVKAVYAWTDKVAIASVMDNLLSNAVKYFDEGSSVVVKLTEGEDNFICSIIDYGKGIAKEEQQNLLNPEIDFTNLKFKEMGSGFGLVVAKELVDALGGRIWFESVEGRGTTFSVSIPKYDEKIHKVF